jgi:formate hydrogenlyase transcriptional activator
LDLQVKLLRVLQEKEFERLGSNRSSRVNVRVVAATNRDLLPMIESKQFRADLYYRLNVFPIVLPPLRERPEDIPALVRHFAAMYAERMNKAVEVIPLETLEAMLSYDWPGNIRELQNFIERGIIISKSPVFRPDLDQIRPQRARPPESRQGLDEATRNHIVKTLDEVKWVLGGQHGAATRLGIPRTTLICKMRRLGIESRHGATSGKGAASSQSIRVSGGAVSLRDLERDHVIKALEETKWKIGGPNSAAERLGLARTSLIHRMRKFGIPRDPSN